MSDKKEWLKADIDELINIYHLKPELWDVKCKNYKDRVKKQDALTEIAEKFQTTTEEICRKIHNLRNQYNNELKKTKKSGSGSEDNYVPKWSYFKLLSFLQGSSLFRSTKENIAIDNAKIEIEDDALSVVTEENDKETHTVEDTTNKNTEIVHIHKKIQKRTSNDWDMIFQKAAHTLNQGDDQYTIFGTFVASEMRNIKSEYLRKRMKRKIQQIILEINEEEEEILRIGVRSKSAYTSNLSKNSHFHAHDTSASNTPSSLHNETYQSD